MKERQTFEERRNRTKKVGVTAYHRRKQQQQQQYQYRYRQQQQQQQQQLQIDENQIQQHQEQENEKKEQLLHTTTTTTGPTENEYIRNKRRHIEDYGQKMTQLMEDFNDDGQTLENGGGDLGTMHLNVASPPSPPTSPSSNKMTTKSKNYVTSLLANNDMEEEGERVRGRKMPPPPRRSSGRIPKDHCIYFACQYKQSLAKQINSFKTYSLINYRRFIPI